MIGKKRWKALGLFLLAAAAWLLPGCRTHSGGDAVQVRLINAVPGSGGLAVSVDGQRVWKNALFRSSTGYQGMAAGTYRVRLDSDTLGEIAPASRPILFEKGRRYTVLALGQAANATAEVLEDAAPGDLPADKAELRLIQAVPGTVPMDLVVNNIVGLKSVRFGQRSDALHLDAGVYDLKVAAANAPDALTGPIRLHLDAGHAYTLVATGQASAGDLSLEAYPDNP